MANVISETVMAAVKKKQNTTVDQVKMIQESVQNLPLNDRAMIYAIVWCSSDKSNLERYPMDNLLAVAERIRNFIR